MNRAMRRSAARLKVRPGRRTPRLCTAPMLVKAQSILHPLEPILDQLEFHDTIDIVGDAPVFRDASDPRWFELSPSLLGVIEFFEEVGKRKRIAVDVSPIEDLRQGLLQGDVHIRQIHAVRRLLPKLQTLAAQLTQDEAQAALEYVQRSTSPSPERTGESAQ